MNSFYLHIVTKAEIKEFISHNEDYLMTYLAAQFLIKTWQPELLNDPLFRYIDLENVFEAVQGGSSTTAYQVPIPIFQAFCTWSNTLTTSKVRLPKREDISPIILETLTSPIKIPLNDQPSFLDYGVTEDSQKTIETLLSKHFNVFESQPPVEDIESLWSRLALVRMLARSFGIKLVRDGLRLSYHFIKQEPTELEFIWAPLIQILARRMDQQQRFKRGSISKLVRSAQWEQLYTAMCQHTTLTNQLLNRQYRLMAILAYAQLVFQKYRDIDSTQDPDEYINRTSKADIKELLNILKTAGGLLDEIFSQAQTKREDLGVLYQSMISVSALILSIEEFIQVLLNTKIVPITQILVIVEQD